MYCSPRDSGSSPHTRGARVGDAAPLGGDGIIPAYAGSTVEQGLGYELVEDHPRIRGEHVAWSGVSEALRGSSPHTRGALDREAVRTGIDGIIPAYAGSTSMGNFISIFDPDHPRIRGEHVTRRMPETSTKGSSPHTRGAPPPAHGGGRRPRIIPAYAGSTVVLTLVVSRDQDHPRIRGEHMLGAVSFI